MCPFLQLVYKFLRAETTVIVELFIDSSPVALRPWVVVVVVGRKPLGPSLPLPRCFLCWCYLWTIRVQKYTNRTEEGIVYCVALNLCLIRGVCNYLGIGLIVLLSMFCKCLKNTQFLSSCSGFLCSDGSQVTMGLCSNEPVVNWEYYEYIGLLIYLN